MTLQSNQAVGQISDYKFAQLFNRGFEFILNEDYDRAETIFVELNKLNQAHGQVGYLLGMCQVMNESADESTIEVLELASKYFSDSHQRGRVEDRSAPPSVWYYLAKAYESKGMFKEALDTYRIYTNCARLGSKSQILESEFSISRLKEKAEKQST
jgi:tetratricopeptide (TPR) repeat protein